MKFDFQARSCSSGKQRRSRFPSALADKEITPKIPFVSEERLVNSGKPRSPSPPVRRSISTDRGSTIKSRVKADATDNQSIAKLPFPARVPVNRSIAAMPMIPSTDSNSRLHIGSQEPTKHDNISDAFYSLPRGSAKKVHPEHEEEQFKQALYVRQGGIRKSKAESKAKAKHNQLPARIHKSEVGTLLLSDMDFAGEKTEEAPRKSDFSEPENDHGGHSPTHAALKVKKLRQNFSRISQNLEPRL